MKQYTISEKDFDQLLTQYGFPVVQLNVSAGPTEKVSIKTGERKVVTYDSMEQGGRIIPNAIANVSMEDVFRDEEIPTRLITFQFVNQADEDLFDSLP